ncbi:MAG: TadE/TadG family type IV pilus assembly protein [Pseudomonadota bacterium]
MRVGLPSFLTRLRRRKDGATAVEFALVAPVFFALIFSMIETGWLMTKASMLDYAVNNSSRMIYTGQAPTQGALEQLLCDEAIIFPNCRENIVVELTVVDDFTSIPDTAATCTDANTTPIKPVTEYVSGSGGEIVFLRVCITTDVLTPGLGLGLALAESGEGRFEMVSSLAFMNEPF